jgi:chromosome segregation ATPase
MVRKLRADKASLE